eukprot:scaffold1457_cov185-Amphora_coffeaeformis.AAC.1
MLDRKECSQIEHVVERKSQRLHVTESLHDYFAVNPKAKYNHEKPAAVIFPDDSEQSDTSTTAKSSSSLDETFHERITESRAARPPASSSSSSSSLDTTFHSQRIYRERTATPATTESSMELPASQKFSSSTRKVRWLTDMDPSDGAIE